MQRYSVLIATVLIVVIGVTVAKRFYASGPSGASSFIAPNGKNLQQAVIDVHRQAMLLSGRQGCGHAEALSELAATMNVAQGLVPEEERRLRNAGRLPSRALLYLVGRPTGPWQVVLAEATGGSAIRIEGYGADRATPLISKSVRCHE